MEVITEKKPALAHLQQVKNPQTNKTRHKTLQTEQNKSQENTHITMQLCFDLEQCGRVQWQTALRLITNIMGTAGSSLLYTQMFTFSNMPVDKLQGGLWAVFKKAIL